MKDTSNITLLTVSEVAKLLRISRGTVRRVIAKNHIPAMRISNRILVKQEDLINFINASKAEFGPDSCYIR